VRVRYPYFCFKCNEETEVEKPLSDLNRPEICDCGQKMARMISEKVSFKGEKVGENQSYYHPALGCEVRSEAHARQIAKSKGLVEVGNESQDHLRPKTASYELTRRDIDDVFGIGEVRGK
jgi:hypothetical protein